MWMRQYPWLVVLDGLDEVPSSESVGWVVEAIEDFGTGNRQTQVETCSSSRTTAGHNQDLDPANWDYRHLADLP